MRALVSACDSNPGTVNERIKDMRALHLLDHGPDGYHLTEHGLGLVGALTPLNRWVDEWAEQAGQDLPASLG